MGPPRASFPIVVAAILVLGAITGAIVLEFGPSSAHAQTPHPGESRAAGSRAGTAPAEIDRSATPLPQGQVAFGVNETLVLRTGQLLPGNVRNVTNVNYPLAVSLDNESDELAVAGSQSENVAFLSSENGSAVVALGTGFEPSALAFDPDSNETFVANTGSNNVSVISDTDHEVLASIPVGESPDALAVDSTWEELFVANLNNASVSVISIGSDSVVATIAVGEAPEYLTVASAGGEVFVGSGVTDNISVISVQTDSVVATLPLGTSMDGFAFDAADDHVFASLGSIGEVVVMSASTNRILGNVSSGLAFPYWMVFDAGTDQLYVSEWFGGTVAVLSGTTYSVVATISTGRYPGPLVYDPAHSTVDLLLPYQNAIAAISDTTDRVLWSQILGTTLDGLVYAEDSGAVYAANFASGNVTEIDPVTGSVIGHLGVGEGASTLFEDTKRGELFVLNEGAENLTVLNESTGRSVGYVSATAIPTTAGYAAATSNLYLATFPSTSFTVLSDTSYDTVATIPDLCFESEFVDLPGPEEMAVLQQAQGGNTIGDVLIVSEANGAQIANLTVGQLPNSGAYDPSLSELFVTNEESNDVSILSIASDSVVGSIDVGNAPGGLAYDPSTSELFVANEGSNDVSVISTISDQVIATVPVGLGPAQVAFDPISGTVFVGDGGSGTVSVLAPLPGYYLDNVSLTVDPATCGPAQFNYTTTARATVVSGDYFASVSACDDRPFAGWTSSGGVQVGSPSSLSTLVAVTGSGSLTAHFGALPPNEYTVLFEQAGLPPTARWSVDLGGTVVTGAGTTLGFDVPNGTYTYQVTGPSGYRVSPDQGMLTVDGSLTTLPVTFEPVRYTVLFDESGLPAGAAWGISINGSDLLGASTSLSELVAPGTYAWSAEPVAGYNASPAAGTVSVGNANVTVNLAWSHQPSGPGVVSTTPSTTLPWTLIIALIVVGVGVMVVAVWAVVRKRPRSGPPP